MDTSDRAQEVGMDREALNLNACEESRESYDRRITALRAEITALKADLNAAVNKCNLHKQDFLGAAANATRFENELNKVQADNERLRRERDEARVWRKNNG